MPKKSKSDPFAEFDSQPPFDSTEGEVFDLTGIPDEPEYTVLPAGVYDGVVDAVEYKTSSNGNPMLVWQVMVQHEGEGVRQFFHTVLTGNPNALVRTKKTLGNLVEFAPGKDEFDAKNFDPRKAADMFVGTPCRCKVSVGSYQGKPTNNVQELLPPSASADEFI